MAHQWTDALLDEARGQMDPPADEAAAAVLSAGRLEAINALMRTLTHNSEPVPEELPEPVRGYFEAGAELPEWADAKQIEAGQALFVRYGLPALQGLLYRALPECYGIADGAEVQVSAGTDGLIIGDRVSPSNRVPPEDAVVH